MYLTATIFENISRQLKKFCYLPQFIWLVCSKKKDIQVLIWKLAIICQYMLQPGVTFDEIFFVKGK